MPRTGNGVEYEPAALDRVERRFWREIWASVPAEVAADRGIELRQFGPMQATVVGQLPGAGWANLVLGSTEPEAVVGGHLAAALKWAGERGVSPYVPVSPDGPETEAAERALAERGFEAGKAWMKFVRDAHLPRFSPAGDVEVVEVTDPDQEPFGMIAATGFGMPAWAAALFAGLPGREGWRCYVSRVDGAAYACGAMLLDGKIAEFGIGATLEPARRRGCQLALLHRRLVDAHDAGAKLLFVETGQRVPDAPAASYRNILRAGFEEAYLRPNWIRRELPGAVS